MGQEKKDRSDAALLRFYVDQRKFPWESEAGCLLRLMGVRPTKGVLVRIPLNGRIHQVFMDPARAPFKPTEVGTQKQRSSKTEKSPEDELSRILSKLPHNHPARMSHEGRV